MTKHSPPGLTQSSLRDWWNAPPRTGARLIISPWEYRHLRTWAAARGAAGVVLIALGVITLLAGGDDTKTYAWTLAFAGAGAASLAWAHWDLTIARAQARRAPSDRGGQ